MLPLAFDFFMYSIYSVAYDIIGLDIVHWVNIILCYSYIFSLHCWQFASRAQCCCREDQMAQWERWGLWPPMSQYFPRPPFPSRWIDFTGSSMGEAVWAFWKDRWDEGTSDRKWADFSESQQLWIPAAIFLQVQSTSFAAETVWDRKERWSAHTGVAAVTISQNSKKI